MARARVDRVMHSHGRGPWIASGVVVALGLVVLVWFVSPTERKRRAAMETLGVGADSARVVAQLGAPVRCPGAATEQIRASFPEEWAPAAVESALGRLEGATRQRWVYAINPRVRPPCATREPHTEIGVGADGRVLWQIPVTGSTPIELPEDYTPSGGAS